MFTFARRNGISIVGALNKGGRPHILIAHGGSDPAAQKNPTQPGIRA